MLPLIGGLIAGGIGALGKIGAGIFQGKQANKINPVYEPYETSEYAKSQLGLAQQMFGGRMFGAGDLEKNIYGSQAGYMGNVNRNATDSSQALALGGLAQGQTNQAFQNLQIQEQQNKYGLLDNLNRAYQTMTNEDWKEYQDMLNKYELDTKQKDALRESSWSNIFGGISDIGGGLIGMDNLGLFGGGGGKQKSSPFANEDYSLGDVNVPNLTSTPSMIPNTAMNRSSGSYSVNTNPYYGMVGVQNPYK